MPAIIGPRQIHLFNTFEGLKDGAHYRNEFHHFEYKGHHFVWLKKVSYEWFEYAIKSHIDHVDELHMLKYRLDELFKNNRITIHYILTNYIDHVIARNVDGKDTYRRTYVTNHYECNAKEKDVKFSKFTEDDLYTFKATYGIEPVIENYLAHWQLKLGQGPKVDDDSPTFRQDNMLYVVSSEVERGTIPGEHKVITIDLPKDHDIVVAYGKHPSSYRESEVSKYLRSM